jgi:hypothetical protein
MTYPKLSVLPAWVFGRQVSRLAGCHGALHYHALAIPFAPCGCVRRRTTAAACAL